MQCVVGLHFNLKRRTINWQ